MNRNPFSLLEVTTLLLFISLGFWIGTRFEVTPPAQGRMSHLKPTPSPVPSLSDGERILLLVGVDQLNTSQPQLKSLWLLTYYLDELPVQLLPIYPAQQNPHSLPETQIQESFSVIKVDGMAQLHPQFINFLMENDFWLSGYVLIDDHATASIIDMLGGLPTTSGLCSGEQVLKSIPPSADHPQKAQTQQATLLRQACLAVSRQANQPEWDAVLALMPEHIITDLNPVRLLSEIKILASDHSLLRCEFPSISTTP